MKIKPIIIAFLFLFSIYINGQETYVPDLLKLYQFTDSCFVDLKTEQKPFIGLSASRTQSGSSVVQSTYIQAVLKAGGIPIIIPAMTDGIVLRDIVKSLDGLVMTGGEDVNPSYYKEKAMPKMNEIDSLRDFYDLVLLKLAADRNVPVLGICRGEQIINVAFGGTLYQDIPTQLTNKSIIHKQNEPREQGTHDVSISENSQLAAILGTISISTNTYHHQAVKKVAPNFRAVAHTKDGIIESIEAYPNRAILGVQWHPEGHVSGGDTTMLKIFNFIVKEANTFKRAKNLHKRILSVDTHSRYTLRYSIGV